MKRHRIALLLFLLPVFAAEDCEGEGTMGAHFLDIGIGARACAMGEAYSAVADDPSAIYWNPAGLSRVQSFEFMITQNFWLLDMSYQHAATAFPVRSGTVGIGLSYSSSGKMDRVENFLRVGEYSAYDGSIDIAYARQWMGSLSLGVVGKYIFEKIEDESASTLAAGMGLLFSPSSLPGMHLALALQNMGSEVKFIEEGDPLPFNVRIGAGYLNRALVLSADVNQPLDSEIRIGLGGEYALMGTLSLRAGYCTTRSFSLGLGVLWKSMELGYAFLPYKDIDHSHILSLRFRAL